MLCILYLQRQSTSNCNGIFLEMCSQPLEEKFHETNTSDIQGAAQFLSFFYSLACGDCNDEFIEYYKCDGDDEMIEEIRRIEIYKFLIN